MYIIICEMVCQSRSMHDTRCSGLEHWDDPEGWDGEGDGRGIQDGEQTCYRYTRVPHPEPPSLLPPGTIHLGRLSAPAPSIQYHASNLDWRFVSYMILYMFQCHSPKSSHPLPLPQSPKDCSIHLCLFCCLACRVIITIFLNSIYMH